MNSSRKKAFWAAFSVTLPIFAGFTFMGMAYGIYMNASGFSFLYPMLMSLTVFGGSVQFVAVGLLLAPFDPLNVLSITLMVSARHLFYGISMLDSYRGAGFKKLYMIFGMCDETFSINCTHETPEGVDRIWFMFFVTVLDHFYWVFGSTLGGLFGSVIQFNTKGLEFVMTALFVVIFTENWTKEKNHYGSMFGLGLSLLCLIFFGKENFMIPSMVAILVILTMLQKNFQAAGAYR